MTLTAPATAYPVAPPSYGPTTLTSAMFTPLAPAAPITPTAPVVDRPILDTASLAELFATAADPAAELAALVVAVAAKSPTAARQGLVLHTVESACKQVLKNVRTALLAAVIDAANPAGRPGVYDGFTITEKAGSRSLSYSDLETSYPDVYAELVTVGNPSLVVSYTG